MDTKLIGAEDGKATGTVLTLYTILYLREIITGPKWGIWGIGARTPHITVSTAPPVRPAGMIRPGPVEKLDAARDSATPEVPLSEMPALDALPLEVCFCPRSFG
jgi:hypothetical protein